MTDQLEVDVLAFLGEKIGHGEEIDVKLRPKKDDEIEKVIRVRASLLLDASDVFRRNLIRNIKDNDEKCITLIGKAEEFETVRPFLNPENPADISSYNVDMFFRWSDEYMILKLQREVVQFLKTGRVRSTNDFLLARWVQHMWASSESATLDASDVSNIIGKLFCNENVRDWKACLQMRSSRRQSLRWLWNYVMAFVALTDASRDHYFAPPTAFKRQ